MVKGSSNIYDHNTMCWNPLLAEYLYGSVQQDLHEPYEFLQVISPSTVALDFVYQPAYQVGGYSLGYVPPP